MLEAFLGCTVSIKCIDDLGSYQGQIIGLNDQSVTLAKAFCNGIPHNSPYVTVRANDILNIDIVSLKEPSTPLNVFLGLPSQKDAQTQNKVTVKKPIAKRRPISIIDSNATEALDLGETQAEVQSYAQISNSNGKIGKRNCAIPMADPATTELDVGETQSDMQSYAEISNSNRKIGRRSRGFPIAVDLIDPVTGVNISEKLSEVQPYADMVNSNGKVGKRNRAIQITDLVTSELDVGETQSEVQSYAEISNSNGKNGKQSRAVPIALPGTDQIMYGKSQSEIQPYTETSNSNRKVGRRSRGFPIDIVDSAIGVNVSEKLSEVQPFAEMLNANGKTGLGQSRTSRKKMNGKDEEAFGTPIDQSLHQDFDFEKNLALFNKEAVWQEINSKKPDVVQQSQNRGNNKARYRHDENIIESEPTTFRQIVVPNAGPKEYVTDDGLIIPSITLELQRQLIGAADRFGISWERRVELLGRAGTEIILQLLGGAHRLNPNNAHQWPTVVALCGPHRSGAAGINCARQLSSHGVKTVVYVESSEDVFLLQELSLYKLTGHRVETDVNKLPPVADLIILALYEEKSPRSITPVSKWANNNRASILAIEPPSTGTPGIVSKYCLVSGLPLSHCVENGRLYLCNLALPNKIFQDVGIIYRPPFGPKFVIPLHLNSS